MTYAFIGLMVLYRLTEAQKKHCVENSVPEDGIVPMVVTEVANNNNTVSGRPFVKLASYTVKMWVDGAEEGDQPGEWEAITNG